MTLSTGLIRSARLQELSTAPSTPHKPRASSRVATAIPTSLEGDFKVTRIPQDPLHKLPIDRLPYTVENTPYEDIYLYMRKDWFSQKVLTSLFDRWLERKQDNDIRNAYKLAKTCLASADTIDACKEISSGAYTKFLQVDVSYAGKYAKTCAKYGGTLAQKITEQAFKDFLIQKPALAAEIAITWVDHNRNLKPEFIQPYFDDLQAKDTHLAYKYAELCAHHKLNPQCRKVVAKAVEHWIGLGTSDGANKALQIIRPCIEYSESDDACGKITKCALSLFGKKRSDLAFKFVLECAQTGGRLCQRIVENNFNKYLRRDARAAFNLAAKWLEFNRCRHPAFASDVFFGLINFDYQLAHKFANLCNEYPDEPECTKVVTLAYEHWAMFNKSQKLNSKVPGVAVSFAIDCARGGGEGCQKIVEEYFKKWLVNDKNNLAYSLAGVWLEYSRERKPAYAHTLFNSLLKKDPNLASQFAINCIDYPNDNGCKSLLTKAFMALLQIDVPSAMKLLNQCFDFETSFMESIVKSAYEDLRENGHNDLADQFALKCLANKWHLVVHKAYLEQKKMKADQVDKV